MTYAKQVAKAVRDHQWNRDAKKLTDDELDAIIAAIPKPEPVATVLSYPSGKSISWSDRAIQAFHDGTPLYAEPMHDSGCVK